MRLSFVIPAYNEEDHLGACLESILQELSGKSYKTEIIVVNNASTDKTREVALSYPEVKVVDEPKKGLVSARKAGYLAASGELIANIDADTRLTSGWVDKVINAFAKNPNLVAYSGPFIYYDLSWFTNAAVWLFYGLGYIFYLINRFILRLGSMLQGGNFVIKKSAFDQVGGYNEKFTFYGEDTEVARQLTQAGDVVFSFRLPVYTSGRRIKNEGAIKSAAKYAINYFWTVYFKKPFHSTNTDIRHR